VDVYDSNATPAFILLQVRKVPLDQVSMAVPKPCVPLLETRGGPYGAAWGTFRRGIALGSVGLCHALELSAWGTVLAIGVALLWP